jgi:hypothetical protein
MPEADPEWNPMTLLFNVVGKTLEKLTEETVKHSVPKLFETLALAEPATAISVSALGSLLPAIVSALFESADTTARVEGKLDDLIAGPFIAAHEAAKTAVTAKWTSKAELAERTRLLRVASDSLMQAYGNAQRSRPELCDPIRTLQAIVHALRPEARPALDLCIRAFRGAAADARLKADGIDYRIEHLYDEASNFTKYFDDRQVNRYLAWGVPQTRMLLEADAERLRSEAEQLERICAVLLTIADNRDAIFERLSAA